MRVSRKAYGSSSFFSGYIEILYRQQDFFPAHTPFFSDFIVYCLWCRNIFHLVLQHVDLYVVNTYIRFRKVLVNAVECRVFLKLKKFH